jgi:hypothetical protein
MKPLAWYRARIRWAEMVEGRGIRHWEEGLYLFRSENREAAFRRALAIGEGGQSGGEEGGHRRRWVETRLAEVVTLDCLGGELKEEEPLEVHWIRLPATEKIDFEHKVRTGQESTRQFHLRGRRGGRFLERPRPPLRSGRARPEIGKHYFRENRLRRKAARESIGVCVSRQSRGSRGAK